MNMNNKLKKLSSAATTPNAESIVKPNFIPIKDKIKQMETNNRLEAEKIEFEKIFTEVTCKEKKSPRIEALELKSPAEKSFHSQPQIEDKVEDEKTDDEKSVEKRENGNEQDNEDNNDCGDYNKYGGDDSCSSNEGECNGNSKYQNGSNNIPPKPLPRTSRTNSIVESISLEEVVSPTPRPQPKPRTTAYKVSKFSLHRIFVVFFCLCLLI